MRCCGLPVSEPSHAAPLQSRRVRKVVHALCYNELLRLEGRYQCSEDEQPAMHVPPRRRCGCRRRDVFFASPFCCSFYGAVFQCGARDPITGGAAQNDADPQDGANESC
ncbi:unnamed protein product, partial [Phaeothamnion confervicola]